MKKIIALLLSVLLVLGTVGLASAEEYVLRFNTDNVPDSATYKSMEAFKAAIEESTNGQVKVELYHSGSLYTSDGQYDAMKNGDLEMIFSDQFWLADEMPYLSMLTAGYAFKGYDHMQHVFNSEIGQQIFDDVAETMGFRPLGAYYFGSRVVSTRKGVKKIVETPADMGELNFRMPNTPAYLFLGKALGTNPTPMALGEVYMGLSTGAIDGQDNPLPTLESNSFDEVTGAITMTNHILSSVWPCIREDLWQSMDAELQQKILDAVEIGRQTMDGIVLGQEESLVETFKGQGITIIEPDLNTWIEHVQAYYLADEEMTASWDMDLYEKINAMD